MEFVDLKAQYKKYKTEIDLAVQKVLDGGAYILGAEVSALETELAGYVGAKYCVTCANGTDALSLALGVLGIGAGDAVFLPTFTFFATAETVSRAGAVPVFVDVDRDTFNLDAAKLETAVENVLKEGTSSPKAVLPVDLFGLPCDYDKVGRIAKKYGLFILEDGAQGFGGECNEKRACSFGDIATTSFFPAKPLGCYGDGGAVFTSDEGYYKELLSLRFHGKGDDKYDNVRLGWNSRLDTIQAGILRVKLKAFSEFELKRRREIAKVYDSYLNGVVKTPVIPAGYKSSYAQYTLTLESQAERDGLQIALKREGVPAMVYYPKCMHQQTAYKNNPSVHYDVSVSEYLSERVLSLPMHPYLSDDDVKNISDAVRRGLKK